MKIFKYKLEPTLDYQTLKLPASPKLLHVGVQGRHDEDVCLWFLVNDAPENPIYEYTFIIKPTGGEVDHRHVHLGTVQMTKSLGLVWHVFERKN